MRHTLALVKARALIRPDDIALMMPDRAVTYAMLASGIASVASWCHANLDPSFPLVAVSSGSPIRATILSLGLFEAGFTSLAAAPRLLEKAAALGAHALFCDTGAHPPAGMRGIVADERIFSFAPGTTAPAGWHARRVARVEFTSGSTGEKKAIGLTADAIDCQTRNRVTAYGLGEPRALCLFPVSANVGFGFVLAMLALGRTTAFGASNDEFVHLLRQFSITGMLGSPAQVATLIRRHEELQIAPSTLRQVILAGSMVTRGFLADVRQAFGAETVIDYGSTETGPVALASDRLVHDDDYRVVPHQEMKVEAPEGAPGPLRVRSSGMGLPFAGNLVQDAADTAEYWFRPGDVGVANEDGSVSVLGREDFLINIGGTKIAPERIEARLARTFGLDRVCAVALPGSADLQILHDGQIDIAADRISQGLSDLLPSMARVRCVRVASFPMTVTGKIDRQALVSLVRS